jgi:hypothetical protein
MTSPWMITIRIFRFCVSSSNFMAVSFQFSVFGFQFDVRAAGKVQRRRFKAEAAEN